MTHASPTCRPVRSLARPHARSRRRGHTLVELSVAVALSVGLAIGLAETVGRAISAHRQILVQDVGTRLHQRTLGDIRRAAFSAIRVLGYDGTGGAYLDAIEKGALTLLPGSRLPVLDTSGRLAEDIVERKTGNALLFVVEEQPLDLTPVATTYRLDVVRFVAFYLTRVNEKVIADQGDRIDLVQFTSMPYVLLAGVDAVTDTAEQDALLDELVTLGYDRLITLDVALNVAFHDIDAAGTVASSPTTSPVIAASTRHPPRRLLRRRQMSVAENGAAIGVPRFALPDTNALQYPSGLEVKVAGPWAARRVLIRLALVTGAAGSLDIATDITKVFTVGAR